MVKEIILEIPESDFANSNYMDCEDCVITRALARAGYPEYYDSGTCIVDKNCFPVTDNIDSMKYRNLSNTVCRMYNRIIERASFCTKLKIEIDEDE